MRFLSKLSIFKDFNISIASCIYVYFIVCIIYSFSIMLYPIHLLKSCFHFQSIIKSSTFRFLSMQQQVKPVIGLDLDEVSIYIIFI